MVERASRRAWPVVVLASFLASCGAPRVTEPPSRGPSTATTSRAPTRVSLVPVVQSPLSSAPTHFDPRGRLVARCSDKDCDVWVRDGDYRGSVDVARCAGWVQANPKPESTNAAAGLEIVRDDEGLALRARRGPSMHRLVAAPRSEGCDDVAAWSADGTSLALWCGDELTVFDAHTGSEVGRTTLDLGAPTDGFTYSWKTNLVLSTAVSSTSASSGGDALLRWAPPAAPVWTKDQPGATAMQVTLDPVAGDAWVMMSTGGGEYVRDELEGPDGEDWSTQSDESYEVNVRAENPAGDAFVIEEKSGTWDSVTTTLNVVRLRPRFERWKVPTKWQDQTIHAVLSSDGDRVVVAADAGRSSDGPGQEAVPRSLVMATHGMETVVTFEDAKGVVPADGAVESLELTTDDRTAVFTSKGIAYAVALDGTSALRRLTPTARGSLSLRVSGKGAFTRSEGEVFTRSSDAVAMRSEGCWFPEGWESPALGQLRVLAGGDAVDGVELDADRVKALFCSEKLYETFVRGDEMPPRPDASMVVGGRP